MEGGVGGYLYVAPGVTISTNGGRIVLAGQTDTNGDGITTVMLTMLERMIVQA